MQRGVRLTGRLVGASGGRADFDGSLEANVDLACFRRLRMLDRLAPGHEATDPAARGAISTRRDAERLDLHDCGIRSVVWVAGHERRYPRLGLPVTDGRGELRHDHGVLAIPGLFVIGLNFLRRRSPH